MMIHSLCSLQMSELQPTEKLLEHEEEGENRQMQLSALAALCSLLLQRRGCVKLLQHSVTASIQNKSTEWVQLHCLLIANGYF